MVGDAGGIRLKVVAILLAVATPAAAISPADRRCRAAIGRRVAAAMHAALDAVDRCHTRRDLGRTEGDCNDGARALALATRRLAALGRECRGAAAVLASFPAGGPSPALAALVAAEVAASGRAAQGSPALGGKGFKRRCHRAIGRGRTALVRTFLARAATCQRRRDRHATVLGSFDPSCFDPRARSGVVARIGRVCRAIGGAEVGSCSVLPDCVADLAATAARDVAAAMYGAPGGDR